MNRHMESTVNQDEWALGDLADPERRQEPIAVEGYEGSDLRSLLRRMVLIRRTEEVIGDLVSEGEVQCPCHLTIGQEACSVGIISALDLPRDKVFGAHRSHGHYLAVGGSTDRLFAEIFGKESGCSRGMGGSMHLIAPERGLLGTVPIVGATVPIACGAALSARMDGSEGVVASFFGDGAAEEGVVQESMNLASTHSLPVIFACENNFFSSHMHIRLRQPTDRVGRFASAHGIPTRTVDGNDVLAVREVAEEAVARGRVGEGPSFIEMVTYRWRGHVGPREDLDVGVEREGDLPEWKKRDPIRRLIHGMMNNGMIDQGDVESLEAEVKHEISIAVDVARDAPFPEADATTRYLYAGSGS